MRYAQELHIAIRAARAAGELLRSELHRPDGPRGQGNHADVDEEVEGLIRAELLGRTPYSYLGEETGEAEGEDPSHVWLVDPNDGTAPFLLGYRGASVSIALVRDGEPVLGVVYAYAYPDDEGDLIAWAEGAGGITRNGAKVPPPDEHHAAHRLDRHAVVIVSHAADGRPIENASCVAPARFLAMPSVAYRLALVAVGEGVGAVSLSGAQAWDFAAGHALLRAAGAELVDEKGRVVAYGRRGHGHVGWCFGGALHIAKELAARPWGGVLTGHAKAPSTLARLTPGSLARSTVALRRAQGCLLGQLAGDALGSLVEFMSPRAIAAKHVGGVHDLVDGGTWDTIAGQPTDDSEMALSLARAIVADHGYLPMSALDAYLRWLHSGPFDIGATTRGALSAAEHLPRSAREAHAAPLQPAGSQANGSLMRISPLGILHAREPAEAARWARVDSGLTHPSPVCREACAAFVAAIAAAIGADADAEQAYAAALAEARRGGEAMVIAALERARTSAPEDFMSQQGWVLIALQNAFHQLLHAATLEKGVVTTVMHGGDTDTNAAIAGALLGAVHGRDAVPVRWRRMVLSCRPVREAGARKPRPEAMWPVDAMVLAERLLLAGGG